MGDIVQLYDYQQECIEEIKKLPDGSSGIVAIATGLGKTVIATHIPFQGRLLFLAHKEELIEQAQSHYAREGYSVGIEQAARHADNEDVVVASVMTLHRDERLFAYSPEEFDVIIIDEAHHSAAKSYRKIIRYFKPRLLIGLTATPKRGDGVRMDDLYQKIIYERSLLWGIQNHYLTPLRCKVITPDVDINDVEFARGDYVISSLMRKIDVPVMFEAIAEAYYQYGYTNRVSTLIFCISIDACEGVAKKIRKRIPRRDWKKIKIITGKTDHEERSQTIQAFKDGKVLCIINVMVLTEGADLPSASLGIIARPSANDSLYIQMCGRLTRKSAGKDEAMVLDILPQSRRRLCSAATLAGVEWKDLTKEQQKAFTEEDGQGILELAEELKSERVRLLSIYSEEISLFEEYYQNEAELIESSLMQSPMALVNAVTYDSEEKRRKVADEDGTFDFLGLRYDIGTSDDSRYIIHGKTTDYEFHLSRPDMLSKTRIHAYVHEKAYESQPLSMEDAITIIKRILVKDCSSQRYMWDKYTEDVWRNTPATKKQIYRLQLLMAGYTTEFSDLTEYSINKYEASVTIDFFEEHQALLDHLSNLRDVYNEAQEKKALQDTRNIEQYDSFEVFAIRYLNVELPEIRQYTPLESGYVVLQLNRKQDYDKSAKYPASEKQLGFIRSLQKFIEQTGAKFDAPLPEIRSGARARLMIDFLLKLRDSDNVDLYRCPTIHNHNMRFVMLNNKQGKPSSWYGVRIYIEYPNLKGKNNQ